LAEVQSDAAKAASEISGAAFAFARMQPTRYAHIAKFI
jgi:hypothetical protein